MLTRRNAIALGGSALIVAGCGGRPARKIAGSQADLPVLGGALELERFQIAFYEAALRVLSGPVGAVAREALAAERAHADTIAELIRELGAPPPAARPASAYKRRIPPLVDPHAWVQAAITREQQVSAAYAAAIPKLVNPRLKATFGSIMTVEAEHAVALDLSR